MSKMAAPEQFGMVMPKLSKVADPGQFQYRSAHARSITVQPVNFFICACVVNFGTTDIFSRNIYNKQLRGTSLIFGAYDCLCFHRQKLKH